ncbi:MAG: Integral membrane protein MviN [candidate division CPR1 bacterium GW2011_GWA2_42_17]|uniref:Integral membrane protein MviN n=1 Tax=candidate division CPR1 bacterium GW2011_GWA2_42_17 TaxID=1618341 RepID=A0A0G1C3K0_9BACT|nr:MAG: Integral membrane protein MviN [candidate division CPR1 bacterium GW2011_GWA2_42_17]
MVKRAFHILNQEISGLHEAAYLLGACALASQLLALFRDRIFASTFGASRTLDIYYSAFRIPDLIFVSIASLVSVSVLIPFFIEKFKNGEESGREFVDTSFSFFFFTITGASLLVFFLVPILTPYVFPGFTGEPVMNQLIVLIRIMLLSPIFLGVSNFLASITQMHNRFFVYALSPILYNIGIIIGVLLFYPLWGLQGLAWGVVLGAGLHFLIQAPFVLEKGLFPKLRFPIEFGEVKNLVFHSLPRTLALSANQIATFFLVGYASLLSAGSIAVFNFSWNLQSVPLSIIGVSYASAAFPALSRYISQGKRDVFLNQMIISARHIIFWSIPTMALFVVLRAQIVRTILGSGNFSWADTRLTAACLAIFIFSVVPQSLLLLFVRGYYALGKTWKPLIINVLSSVFMILLGYFFVYLFKTNQVFRYFIETLFKVDGISGSIVLVLPLSYSVGTFLNTLIHWIAFQGEFKAFNRPVLKTFFTSFSAAVIIGYVAYLFLNVFDKVFNINTLAGIFLQGFFSGIIGIAVGILVLIMMKNEEINDVWQTLHHKIWKAKVVGADPTENTML